MYAEILDMNKINLIHRVALSILLGLTITEQVRSQCVPIETITITGTDTYVVPAGVTTITVEVWGAGGRGGNRTNNGRGGGGGGGAYSRSTFFVTPGESFLYSVGAGSNGTGPGGDTWFGSNITLMAKGGSSAANNSNSGAQGGQASAGFGEIRFSGGNGANSSGSGTAGSGGGGSSAGKEANGTNGAVLTGGVAPMGGGNGGAGTNNGNGDGENGINPGGGGGGARRTAGIARNGGRGGDGQIIISACPCFTILDDGAVSGVNIIQFNADCDWEAPEGLLEFDVLAVAGGGGGGFGNGGGGGGGGIVHANVNIELKDPQGLPAGTTFSINVGRGGNGSDDEDDQGEDGEDSSFDLGGFYQVVAGGGGGGGSQDEGEGRNGRNSSILSGSSGLTSVFLRGGSGGGGADGEDGGNGVNAGGNGGDSDEDESGGGGGGAGGNGQDSDESDGGNGGIGLRFSDFDIDLDRFFGAGGGGGGEDSGGNGGSSGSGGAGGEDDEAGQNGVSPGTGGGGGADDARGGNGARGVVFVAFLNSRILPVEYIYFDANYDAQNNTSKLTWATSKEWENQGFEIQRSLANVENFETIGEVAGKGWSDTESRYEFEDKTLPLTSGIVYYRLKQVDFDGTFAFSKVISIRTAGIKSTNGVWRAFPNPTTGERLRVSLLDGSQYDNEEIRFRLLHPSSLSKTETVNSEEEMNHALQDLLVTMPKGVFVIEIQWGQKVEHIKVLKTN